MVTFVAVYYGGSLLVGSNNTLYGLEQVKRETVIASLSSTGQVVVKNQIDLKPQTSGTVTYIPITVGQKVQRGQILVSLDSRSALISLKQAEASYESAKATYKKTESGATEETILASKSAVDSSKLSLISAKQNAIAKMQDAYIQASDVVYTKTASFFLNPNTLSPTFSITGLPLNNQNVQSQIETSRSAIVAMLPLWKNDLNTLTVDSSLSTDLTKTTDRLNQVAQYLDAISSVLNGTQSTSIDSYKNTVSTARSSVSSLISSTITAGQSIDAASTTLAQNNLSYTLKVAPPTEDDLTIAKAQLVSAEANYLSAQQNYANTIIRAPFDAVVGAIGVKIGDSASSGSSAVTLITANKFADLSLNEVDATKIKLGQKVTLTFDAIEDLTLAGTVSEVSPLGTVSQGVVTYNVKVAFDTDEEVIKPGMSVNANIITDIHPDVLVVSNQAVKHQGTTSYVDTAGDSSQTFTNATSGVKLPTSPTRKSVIVGISNDSVTEIISGLEEGDWVVSRTISQTTTAQTQQTGFSLLGSSRNQGGGAVRATTGR